MPKTSTNTQSPSNADANTEDSATARDNSGAAPSRGALALLQAGERLIGELGINGASFRQIRLAAGMNNNSAVSYHFKDRDGLLRAISEWRLPILVAEMRRLTAAAEQDGMLDDVTTLLNIVFRPIMLVVDDQGRHPHAAFMREMLQSQEGVLIRIALYKEFDDLVEIRERFERALDEFPTELVAYRLRLASIAVYDAICARDMELLGDAFPKLDDEAFWKEMIGMAKAICTHRPS